MGSQRALNVRTWGDPEAPLLVALHGFMGSSSDWAQVAEELSSKYRIVAPDLPGHGLSTRRRGYSLQDAAEQVLQSVEIRLPGGFALAGYSMGGRVALHLLEHVRGLALISAHPGIADRSERDARLKTDYALAAALKADYDRFVGRWFEQPLFATLSPELRDALVARRKAQDPEELARALRGMSVGNQAPFSRAMADFKQPLILVAGSEDRKYAGLYRDVQPPDADLIIVQGAGHNLVVEQPHKVAAALTALMTRIGRNRPPCIL